MPKEEENLEEVVEETTNDEEEIRERPEDYEWEVPFWYEIIEETIIRWSTQETRTVKRLVECKRTPEERIQHRIVYLRNKLIDWTITAEEKEELKLLIW